MLEFNNHGYLVPADVIETDMATFEQNFLFNEHRRSIFQEYTLFLEAIQALGISSFYQWIDGSFTSLKPNPNDLDVVTFIEFSQYETHEDALYLLRQMFRNRKIDGYFVAVYPKEHREYSLFLNYDHDFWHKFTRDFKKEIRLKKQFKKGFIKIQFDYDTRKANTQP
jgi:hypothetical protein